MSMIVAASYLPTRPHTVARLRGLRGSYWEQGDAIPEGAENVVMTALRPGETDWNIGRMGKPLSLAVMYARAPLFWLALLIGLGWAGGFLSWYFLAKR